jgi:flagellar biogenesis protein FliO
VTPPLWDYLLESVVGLAIVAGLGLAVLQVARRVGVARTQSTLEVLGRLPLEARRSVYVVRVLDQVLILGASEGGIAKLGELPESAAGEFRRGPPGIHLGELWQTRTTLTRDGAVAAESPPELGPRRDPSRAGRTE